MLGFFAGGSYPEVLSANWAFLKERWFLAVYTGRIFKLLGMFLIGFSLGRAGIFQEPWRHRRLLQQVLLWGLVVGVPANLALAALADVVPLRPPSMSGWLVAVVKAVGIPALCLAYAAGLTLLFQPSRRQQRLALFAHVGRMSLTNYLFQSIIAVTIFYGVGFGGWGHIGTAWSVPVIVLILIVQAGLSAAWLSRFDYGPVEWLWRSLTYATLLPWRRHKSVHGPAAPASEIGERAGDFSARSL